MSSDAPRILPAHIEQTVRGIAELHAAHNRRASPTQRIVARSVGMIGHPTFVTVISLAFTLWIVANVAFGYSAIDPAPFQWLQDIATGLGLYITILILITQRREDELTHLREQLTLELAILSEQKTAKIIQLLEELRRDSPSLKDRIDTEADALSVPADPQAVMDAIRTSTDEIEAMTGHAGPQPPDRDSHFRKKDIIPPASPD